MPPAAAPADSAPQEPDKLPPGPLSPEVLRDPELEPEPNGGGRRPDPRASEPENRVFPSAVRAEEGPRPGSEEFSAVPVGEFPSSSSKPYAFFAGTPAVREAKGPCGRT